METKDYWFALKSHVYVEHKENKMLLYDTQSGNRIETTFKKAISLINGLYLPENLGVICINKEMLNPTETTFIQEVLDKDMGDLTDVEQMLQKPVRLVPILNLQKDIDKFAERENIAAFLGKDVSKYLQEVNIYLNDTCQLSCKSCKDYYKQFHCCSTTDRKNELSLELLNGIIEQLRYLPIGIINLSGGNIYQYKFLKELANMPIPQDKVHCYIHYKNYRSHEFIDLLKLEILVNFPVDESVLQQTQNLVNTERAKWHFLIETEQQYHEMERLISKLQIEKQDIHPFFTGQNLDFFEDNIFLNKEDIFFKTFQMREIFRNQKLNSNYFGTLHILPNGTVKANMNTTSLGNIQIDEILNIAYKELIENTAWRVIRDMQPCCDCIYQFICPPPSDYERVIKRCNLCEIERS